MLLSATLPLKVRIILSDPFPNRFPFYVSCVCNNCRQTNHNCLLMMGLMIHLSFIFDAFSSYGVYFSLMTSLKTMGLGPGHLVRARFHLLWQLC